MIKGIGTHIKVANFETSRKFYEALGFRAIFEYGLGLDFKKDTAGNLIAAPGDCRGLVFEHEGGKLEIADGHLAVKAKVFKTRMPSSKVSLMIQVDSVADILGRCAKNNIEIAVGPRHYYWGTIEVVVKDPDGVVLVFIQSYDEKMAKQLKADETFGKTPIS